MVWVRYQEYHNLVPCVCPPGRTKGTSDLSPPQRLQLGIPIRIAVIEKIESARGTMGRGERRKMADNRSKNMNCKKTVKQNRNPVYTIIFTTAFKSIQIVGWFSQNHRTANPAREPQIIWQRTLFSFSLSHRAPRAVFCVMLSSQKS